MQVAGEGFRLHRKEKLELCFWKDGFQAQRCTLLQQAHGGLDRLNTAAFVLIHSSTTGPLYK